MALGRFFILADNALDPFHLKETISYLGIPDTRLEPIKNDGCSYGVMDRYPRLIESFKKTAQGVVDYLSGKEGVVVTVDIDKRNGAVGLFLRPQK
jgi:hypothetical protein